MEAMPARAELLTGVRKGRRIVAAAEAAEAVADNAAAPSRQELFEA